MNVKPAKRSSLFLLELIIAILFFSLASAVCIRFFVTSHTLSQDTENLNMAVNQVSAYTELFFAKDDFDDYQVYYFNDNWEKCDKNDAAFILNIDCKRDESFLNGTFSMNEIEKGESIYTLDVRKYIGSTSNTQEVTE